MREQNLDDHRRRTLYESRFEHDACGVGFVADVHGRKTHDIVAKAVESVINVTHRGAVSADGKTGDGAGVLTQIPRKLFARELDRLGLRINSVDDLAVGMFFFPAADASLQRKLRDLIVSALSHADLDLIGWREVPIDTAALGEKAARTAPRVEQALIARPAELSADAFERALYRTRKLIERQARDAGFKDFYVPSLSHRTLVYKGLFVAPQLAEFYVDLRDPDYESALAVFHQRYSTNTFPNWFLAQPFRMLAHNGEINTLQGNRNWMRAREAILSSPVWGEHVADLLPVIWEEGSDSASLDEALDLIVHSGRNPLHAMMMLVPEAWENMSDMDPDLRAFYQYHAALTEPWDGPAALAFTDGKIAAAALDRNGLRPARYKITEDGLVVVASEVGTVELDDAHVVEKGRLGPGQMIAVDTENNLILKNEDIKRIAASREPYREWVARQVIPLSATAFWDRPTANGHEHADQEVVRQQHTFGFSAEELKFVLDPMFATGKEAVWSMGDDTPLAVLSQKQRPIAHYFRQRFAQVTNPPIDPLRETLVMSLKTYLGPRKSILEESEEHARLIELERPLLMEHELLALRHQSDPSFAATTLPTLFVAADGAAGLDHALTSLCLLAERAVDEGKSLLILSDRGVDEHNAPIPMLMAIGAVHHHLIRQGKRMRADLIAETGEAWDVHQIALMIGYGASAVFPYAALETIRRTVEQQQIAGSPEGAPIEKAFKNFAKAVDDGLLKIISKMGISTISSYRGAQIFEIVGLNQEIIDRCFADTPSRVSGIGLEELAAEVLARHAEAYGTQGDFKLKDPGYVRFRRDGEYHGYNPFVIRALHKAVRGGTYDDYRVYADMVNNRPPSSLRDLLRFKKGTPIPLDEVESVETIRRRFTTQAMSLGALSPEAHAAISFAMNRIGGRSNTGEGGEDPSWYRKRDDGDSADNRTKQVASARFGVTTEYLAHASELEIKMAQGSKPGEGGQLPAHKVSELIARFRHAIPGIPLISPPPHHDIYSIEDLAQLIYDLKMVNPRARVGVKLVSEAGVGTIAAGVAKAYADYILISGMDGGTGASPLSSIKGAGCPQELGLSETQQVLVLNDLRGRVTLRTDGGMKTGRDVVVAALLGAEEFGFGTAAVVAIGCDMARQCHLNTCPTGIATQREDLRKKFDGTPEMLIAFLTFVAQEVREILAEMGVRSLDEIVGRVDLLDQVVPENHAKAAKLDLSRVIADVDPSGQRPKKRVVQRNDRPGENPLDNRILVDIAPALDNGTPVKREYAIRNSDRTVGARVAGEIAHRYGSAGLPEGTIDLTFRGSAGQSFGAFVTNGMKVTLIGEANDYVGKGLSGGEIIVRPPANARFESHENVIVGNTVLYGATGGALFVAGRAGERFCVRNSGALAVSEGCGDHGCEYMTSGLAVILGSTGRNFGAGMAAGIAYVLDEDDSFPRNYNPEMVSLERVTDGADADLLLSVIHHHLEVTGSERAQEIIANWERYLPKFWKVVPHPPVVDLKEQPTAAGHAKAAARVKARV